MYLIALADSYGDIVGEPGVEALGRSGIDIIPITDRDMSPLPAGSSLVLLQDRFALGRRKRKKGSKQIELPDLDGERVYPSACIPPPGFTRTLMPAYTRQREAVVLPFFAYSALSWLGDQLYCAAIETHPDLRWNPSMYNSLELPTKIKLKKKKHPGNRLLDHLERCALEYGCFTAQNIFYERWEGGIPVSPACNALCGGCLSENRVPGTDSPQDRIDFIPTIDEVVDLAVSHLENPEAIVSFGQGCEGEPLVQGELLVEAVRKIREQTDAGTININTNGSRPDIVAKLFDAGMDSIRVSMNSAIPERYLKYFKPRSFGFDEVVRSIDTGIEKGKFVSLNYLYMPGVNDREEESEIFLKFLGEHRVSMIQFRNLNIDPDYYFNLMPLPRGKAMRTAGYLDLIREKFPEIRIGNFSIPVNQAIENPLVVDQEDSISGSADMETT